MTDIVERLRQWAGFGYGVEASAAMREAADEITRLRAENERLRAALEAWNHAVRIDVLMEGPRYMGVSGEAGKRAWEMTRAALKEDCK